MQSFRILGCILLLQLLVCGFRARPHCILPTFWEFHAHLNLILWPSRHNLGESLSLYTASTRALPPFLPLLPTVPPPAFKMVLPYIPFIQVCRFVPFTHSYSQLPPIALMKVIIDSMHTVDLHWVNLLAAPRLEWVAMPSSRGSSWPRDRTHVSYVSCIGRWVLHH